MSQSPSFDDPGTMAVLNMIENDDAGSSCSSSATHSHSSSRRANNPYALGASSPTGNVSPQRSGGFASSDVHRRTGSHYVGGGLDDGSSRNSSTHLAFDIGSDPHHHPHSSATPPSMLAFLPGPIDHSTGQLPAPMFQHSDGRGLEEEESCSSSAQSLHHQHDPIYTHNAPVHAHQPGDHDPQPYPPSRAKSECHPLSEHSGGGWNPLEGGQPGDGEYHRPEGGGEVRSHDSSRASGSSRSHQQRRPRGGEGSSSTQPGGMSQVAIATASAPSQGPTDTSSEELASMLRAAYRAAYGVEFDLRTAGPDGRPDDQHQPAPTPPPPPQQPSVDVKCPDGFVFSVYDTDVREHFSVESKDVVITAGAIKYVEYFAKYGYQTRFRFQYCKRFVSGRCTTGNNCHFLHVANLPASTSVHVNENAATSHPTAPVNAQMVVGGQNTHRYATMPAGVVFAVYPPNTSSSSPQLITSSQILHTAGAASVYGLLSTQQRKHIERQRGLHNPYQAVQPVNPGEDNELSALSVERVVHFPPEKRAASGGRTIVIRTPGTPPPPPQGLRPRHCAHFQFKRLCNLGTECNFIHALVPFIQGVTLTRCNQQAHTPPPQTAPQYMSPPMQHHNHQQHNHNHQHQQQQSNGGGFLPHHHQQYHHMQPPQQWAPHMYHQPPQQQGASQQQQHGIHHQQYQFY